jgi:hypothetical protein
VSKKPATKCARIGLSQATPSKMGLPKKINNVKVVQPKVKPRPQGRSEIELALAKPVGVSNFFLLIRCVGSVSR